LGFVFQSAESLAMNDAVAIPLESGTDRIFHLGAQAAARVGALRRLRRENLPLAFLELFTDVTHGCASIDRRKLVPCANGPTANTCAMVCPRSAKVRSE